MAKSKTASKAVANKKAALKKVITNKQEGKKVAAKTQSKKPAKLESDKKLVDHTLEAIPAAAPQAKTLRTLKKAAANKSAPKKLVAPKKAVKSSEKTGEKISFTCRRSIRKIVAAAATLAASQFKSSRRSKERKIGYIIEKVSKWRKLYNGTPQMTIKEAASKMGIPKKSLDDYFLLLRYGQKYGFNFQEHKEEKIRILRAYVKKCKILEVYAEKIQDGEPYPRDIIQVLQEAGTPACKHNMCCVPIFALPYKHSNPQS